MSQIKLSASDKERMVAKIKAYFSAELDQHIGAFEAEFFDGILCQRNRAVFLQSRLK